MVNLRNTAVIYRNYCIEAYDIGEIGFYFSLVPWSKDMFHYEGRTDSAKIYYLPKGFWVGEDLFGDLCIFDSFDTICPILSLCDIPAILFGHEIIYLEEVEKTQRA